MYCSELLLVIMKLSFEFFVYEETEEIFIIYKNYLSVDYIFLAFSTFL